MIKENKIFINITNRNINYYKKLGYNNFINNKLEILTSDLPNNSHQKITAICEKCGNEISIRYHKYLENKNRHGFYSCKSCSNIKREKTSLNEWGVTNYAKTNECKEKLSKNNIKKYGVKTTLLETKTKEKISKKLIKKYGVNSPLSSKIIQDKAKKTILDKYGVEHYSKTDEFYNKTYKRWKDDAIKKLKKYNIDNYILNENRKNRISNNGRTRLFESI